MFYDHHIAPHSVCDELAKRLNVTPKYIRHLAMPSTFKRMENRQCKRQGKLIAIRIGKEDDKLWRKGW